MIKMSFIKPKWWRDRPQNTRLIGMKCEKCGYVSFPEKRRACPKCHAIDSFKKTPLSKTGIVASYIVQYYLPEEFETPQPLAMVELDGGGRIYVLMTDTTPEEMKVGMKVKLEYREILKGMDASICSFKAVPIERTMEENK